VDQTHIYVLVIHWSFLKCKSMDFFSVLSSAISEKCLFFCHGIKIKKVIVTFYLMILTFLHLTILFWSK